MDFCSVTAAGRVVHTPVLKKTKDVTYLEFTVAVNNMPNGDEYDATFLDVTFYDKAAEAIAGQSLSAGMLIAVTGELQMKRWDGQDGKKKSKLWLKGRRLSSLSAPHKADFDEDPPLQNPEDTDNEEDIV